MKKTFLVLVLCLFTAGCGSEFAEGFATGMSVMTDLVSEEAQESYVKSINNLNEKTAENNTTAEALSAATGVMIKPETIEAFKSLKGQEKNPAFWIAIASILAGGTGVNIFKNRKSKVRTDL